MKKLLLAVSVMVMGSASFVVQADEAVEANYNKSCVFCHATGAANAPKTGDAAQWAPRMEKGMDVMVESVQKGLNGMPPTGMCADCSVDDIKALIEYMAAPQ